MVSQLHRLLPELLPAGAKKSRSAAQAKGLPATVPPREAAGKARGDEEGLREFGDPVGGLPEVTYPAVVE
jgi:hypothetical protein